MKPYNGFRLEYGKYVARYYKILDRYLFAYDDQFVGIIVGRTSRHFPEFYKECTGNDFYLDFQKLERASGGRMLHISHPHLPGINDKHYFFSVENQEQFNKAVDWLSDRLTIAEILGIKVVQK